MTAPFAPPPPREVYWVLGGMAVFTLVMPLGRREDWLGRVALLIVCGLAAGLWGLMIVAAVRRFRERRAERRRGE